MSESHSVEVSIPTDLTVTSDDDSKEGIVSIFSTRRQAKEIQSLTAEKYELQRQVEKLKLEIQSKDAQHTTLAAQNKRAINQVIIQKDTLLSEKQIYINRLEGETTGYKEELSTLRERAARELAQLSKKCASFQENQERLKVKHEEIKSSLNMLTVTEEKLSLLRSLPPKSLTLQQYASLRLHELVGPLQMKVRELERTKLSLETCLSSQDVEFVSQTEENRKLKLNLDKVDEKLSQLNEEHNLLKEQQSTDSYKARNFDRVKKERDDLENKLKDLNDSHSKLKLSSSQCDLELNSLKESFNALKLKCKHQEQECAYHKRDISDTQTNLDSLESEVKTLKHSLKFQEENNNNFKEKFIQTRNENINLNEKVKDMQYQITTLNERIEHISENEKITSSNLKDTTQKYNTISEKFDDYKLHNKLMKTELENRLEELKCNLSTVMKSKESLIEENKKLNFSLDKIKSQLSEEKLLRDQDQLSFTQQTERMRNVLLKYESLEKEYDDNIRTISSLSENEIKCAINRLFPGMSYNQYKVLSDTVHLTKKILHLERENIEACQTIQQLTDALEKIKTTISSYKHALCMVGQPVSQYLQQIIHMKDQIEFLQLALKFNESECEKVKQSNATLENNCAKYEKKLIETNDHLNSVDQVKKCLNEILENL